MSEKGGFLNTLFGSNDILWFIIIFLLLFWGMGNNIGPCGCDD